MDIESLSTALSQANVQQQAGVSLLKSSINQMKTAGADVVQLISGSAPAPLPEGSGTKVDLFV